MSKLISQLLGAEEPLFSISLRQLEEVSGRPGVDVRLTAEIIGSVRLKTAELGLDPDDTTGSELYHALVGKIAEHSKSVAKVIGGKPDDRLTDLIPKMKKAVDAMDMPRSCWVLKKSVAKSFLRAMPPPNIMKHLGYTSVESMLKQENLAEIYGALRFAEGPEWLDRFIEQYKKLSSSDFTARDIEIVIMPHDRWADLCERFVHKKKHNITHLKELGVILMLPIKPEARLDGLALFATMLLFHYINEIRLYSAFFKMKQVRPDFGKVLVETLIADPSNAAIMSGQRVHWRVIQRYFGKLENEYHPEIFQPHLQPEDLHWRSAEEWIFQLDPNLEFWRDLDYVAIMYGQRPVAFNMLDAAASFGNKTPYAKREVYHFREALWNEVFIRYMGQDVLEQQILRQLDNDLIAPEALDRE